VHEPRDAAAVQDVRIVDVLEQREERGEAGRGAHRGPRACRAQRGKGDLEYARKPGASFASAPVAP
jgi:hypothetical protein